VFHAPCSMNLHQKIEEDLKVALKSGDKQAAGVLRFLISAIKNHQIEIKAKDEKYLADEEVLAVVKRQAKQRKDSIESYKSGGREDLVEKEEQELSIVSAYMPEQMGESDIRNIVRSKMSELNISDKADFGKLMGSVMQELKGKADGGLVKKIMEEELSK
jgi:uncharacterized protein